MDAYYSQLSNDHFRQQLTSGQLGLGTFYIAHSAALPNRNFLCDSAHRYRHLYHRASLQREVGRPEKAGAAL